MLTDSLFIKKVLILLTVVMFPIWPAGVSEAAKIVCFGDSITVGLGSRTGGYPPKLQYLLEKHGKPAELITSAISGEKTPEGAKRLFEALQTTRGDILLIMEGTNDVRAAYPLEVTRQHLEHIIQLAKEADLVPVVATLTPSNRWHSPALIPQQWNPMIKSLAEKNQILLSDQYQSILPAWDGANADGLHPNDHGYDIIARTWYESIANLICSDGSVIHKDDQNSFLATVFAGVPEGETYLHLLREMRIRYLGGNAAGKKLSAYYSRQAPTWIPFIQQHDAIRTVVRVSLYVLAGISYFLVEMAWWWQFTSLIVVTAVLWSLRLLWKKGQQRQALR